MSPTLAQTIAFDVSEKSAKDLPKVLSYILLLENE